MSDSNFIGGPARVFTSERTHDRLVDLLNEDPPAWKEIGEVVGFEIATSPFIPEDEILLVGKPERRGTLKLYEMASSFGTEVIETVDPYRMNHIPLWRMSMTFEAAPVRVRPSWWHPFRRTLWVHLHGPGVPEIVPSGLHYRLVQRPSWLHPIARTLWVHRNGPHVPELKVTGSGATGMSLPLSFAKITNVTS